VERVDEQYGVDVAFDAEFDKMKAEPSADEVPMDA
jgi:hypothetical protein